MMKRNEQDNMSKPHILQPRIHWLHHRTLRRTYHPSRQNRYISVLLKHLKMLTLDEIPRINPEADKNPTVSNKKWKLLTFQTHSKTQFTCWVKISLCNFEKHIKQRTIKSFNMHTPTIMRQLKILQDLEILEHGSPQSP